MLKEHKNNLFSNILRCYAFRFIRSHCLHFQAQPFISSGLYDLQDGGSNLFILAHAYWNFNVNISTKKLTVMKLFKEMYYLKLNALNFGLNACFLKDFISFVTSLQTFKEVITHARLKWLFSRWRLIQNSLNFKAM
jgi:hypothetical protein